jgi:glycosyltransferase involved in cell wall biosynthesis
MRIVGGHMNLAPPAQRTSPPREIPAGEKQESPQVSIIIPAYNAALTLKFCLEAVLAAPGPSREIVVVDDASDDGSSEIAAALGVRTIKLPINGGAGHARNVGVRHSSSSILVFVDADVVIHDDALERVWSFFNKNPGHAALFGSYDANPTAEPKLSKYRNLLHHFTHQEADRDARTFWTGLGAMRRYAFLGVGGFREQTSKGVEDIELGLRITDDGYRVALDRGLLGTHLKCWTFVSMVRADLLLRARPWSALVLQRGGFVNDLNTTKGHQVGVSSAALFAAAGLLWMVSSAFAYVALVSLIANVSTNVGVYRKFALKMGPAFVLYVMFFHLIHQLCAGTGFALAVFDRTHTSVQKLFAVRGRRPVMAPSPLPDQLGDLGT